LLKYPIAFLMIMYAFVYAKATAQSKNYFFYHLDKKDGLYDGTIRSICQDKFGYIWIGTMSGLYRYNSCGITAFLPELNDSNSIPAVMTTALECDDGGDVWIGTTDGLCMYDYDTGKFSDLKGIEHTYINGLKKVSSRYILAFSNHGLLIIDTYKKNLILPDKKRYPELANNVMEGILYKKKLYLATDAGVVCYNIVKQKTERIFYLNNYHPRATWLEMSGSGTLWAASVDIPGILHKIDVNTGNIEELNVFQSITTNLHNGFNDIFLDSKDRLWISTQHSGLICFNSKDNSITLHQHDPISFYSSLSDNHTRNIFEDKQKNIWVGTEGHGVNYFNPDAPIFYLHIPKFPKKEFEFVWCRAAAKDSEGRTWFGTNRGIEIFDEATGDAIYFQNTESNSNVLHSNSIRSLLCDETGDVWIGTANGVNRFSKKTKKIYFYGSQDSLPNSFFWNILQDSKGRIWFGSRNGLFFKDKNSPQIYSLNSLPALRKYSYFGARSLYEDSRKNLWIGLNGDGALLYDTSKDTVLHFVKDKKNPNGLIGNMITSITEDKDGFIWLSTNTGISRYNYAQNDFVSYNHRNGLAAIKTSCLQVDKMNRLWIGTNGGLYILEKDRKTFNKFNTQNGLPSVEFNDQTSLKLNDSLFLYPTLEGFISFNPEEFATDTNGLDFYLSSFTVHGNLKRFDKALEELETIDLKSNENFFRIEMVSINYKNPSQSWYAYKLEGVHQDWVYTQNRYVDFTNLKGGSYVFRYKAPNDINKLNGPDKKIVIHVSTVFYKRPVFVLFITLLLVVIGFYIVKARFRKQAHILQLESKSRLLEKEKAIAQYENLKQQLNPHLLFNTISSINSMFKIDPLKANEYLENMSKIYRYILKSSNHELVRVENELVFTENYIKLQRIRFNLGLNINITVSKTAREKKIIPVTLQNLVENAIKHNIIDEETPLNVEIYDEGEYLVVRNNLQKKRIVETSNRLGIKHLVLLYGYFSPIHIIISEENNFFTIKIPLL
jgi:ligand-binding sensor domain-containing protein